MCGGEGGGDSRGIGAKGGGEDYLAWFLKIRISREFIFASSDTK